MIRVGVGYDIHRLVPNRPLVLGGVRIPHESGLDGHSDADVVLHAAMDALLGAAALDDIGVHFPPGDARFKNASSVDLLRSVRDKLSAAGIEIGNLDIAIVAEEPKIGPYREQMRTVIADALEISTRKVGLKATTNEGMGPEGRREAISATAVALVEVRSE